MEIRRWLFYAAVNCVLVCCIVGKPFSLNKLIEEESNQKEVVHTTLSSKFEEPEPAAERFSLNKGLKPLSRISKKFKETTGTTLNLIPLSKKISPLKYRKTFQIKSPLKPKRVKLGLKTRQKRKNQSIQREIDGNAILNQKYIPLLKSLGMLFDNILGTDSGESFEITKRKKRLRYIPEGDDDVPCKCPRQRETNAESESKEETVTDSEALTTQISVTTEATPKTTDHTPAGNLRSFRRNKNVSLLLPRNTFGTRGNNHGFGERSRATHNGSAERDISGDNGDSKHNPKWGQNKSNAESNEKYTSSNSRNDASGVRFRGAIRRRESRNNTEEVNENDAISKDEAENLDGPRGDSTEYNGQDKLETERDEAKSAKLLPEPVRTQRGLSEGKVSNTAEPVQSEEDNEESDVNVAYDSSGDQRIFDGDGSHSTEDQKASARHETIIHQPPELETPQYVSTKHTKTSRTKGPVVVIIDGYSVTRQKNGENKLAEKTIRFRP